MAIQSINPATGKTIKIFSEASPREVETALLRAEKAFKQWRALPIKKRAGLMKRVAQILEKEREELGQLATLEMGKPISQSFAEVEKSAWVCRYFAEHGEDFLRDESVKTESQKSYVRFEPLGLILAVMPWNFPFWQVFRFAAPVLMGGNTVVLKHASNVPQCALAIEALFDKAGFPKGVFTSLLVESSRMASIIEDFRIAAVTITGSEAAGSKIAEGAGKNIKKTVLELGGSDPFIILEDADFEHCCTVAVQSRIINAGQSCIAAKRFIVVEKVVRRFTELFVKTMQNLRIGDPLDPQIQIGPLAREDLLTQIDKQVQNSIKKGARLLIGGKRLNREGYFYSPTVLDRVKSGMPVYEEEIFGPVASIIAVRGEDKALRIANDTRFGLGASIWSKDIKRAEQIAQKLDAGAVFINDLVKSDPRLPFGGVKKSGYGRELGIYGIKEFVNIKTIVVK